MPLLDLYSKVVDKAYSNTHISDAAKNDCTRALQLLTYIEENMEHILDCVDKKDKLKTYRNQRDFANRVLRDTNNTSFHIGEYTDRNDAESRLTAFIQQFKSIVEGVLAAQEKSHIEPQLSPFVRFINAFEYHGAVGCIEARLANPVMVGSQITTNKPLTIEDIFTQYTEQYRDADRSVKSALDYCQQYYGHYVLDDNNNRHRLTPRMIIDYCEAILALEPSEDDLAIANAVDKFEPSPYSKTHGELINLLIDKDTFKLNEGAFEVTCRTRWNAEALLKKLNQLSEIQLTRSTKYTIILTAEYLAAVYGGVPNPSQQLFDELHWLSNTSMLVSFHEKKPNTLRARSPACLLDRIQRYYYDDEYMLCIYLDSTSLILLANQLKSNGLYQIFFGHKHDIRYENIKFIKTNWQFSELVHKNKWLLAKIILKNLVHEADTLPLQQVAYLLSYTIYQTQDHELLIDFFSKIPRELSQKVLLFVPDTNLDAKLSILPPLIKILTFKECNVLQNLFETGILDQAILSEYLNQKTQLFISQKCSVVKPILAISANIPLMKTGKSY